MRRSTTAVIYTAAICMTLISQLPAADWPNWRGPDKNGISKETNWSHNWRSSGPKVLWRAKVGIGFSTFSVVDGRVYTMGNTGNKQNKRKENQDDVIYCFDAKKGTVLWKHVYKHPLMPKYYEGGTSATPTIHDGRVYTVSKAGIALCLDAKKGSEIWKRDLVKEHKFEDPTWGFAGSVHIFKDLLIINIGTHGAALKAKDGSLAWSTGTKKAGYSTPVQYAIGGKQVVAIFGEETLAGVDAEKGKVMWSIPWKANHDENIADPIIIGNMMFVSSNHGKRCSYFKIKPNGLTEIWKNRNMLSWMNTAVVLKDHVYGINAKKQALQCTKYKTGETVWENKGYGQGQVMLAGDRLIAIQENGTLKIVKASPAGFKELASAKVMKNKCWTVPVLANGMIYLRDAMGDVVCLDVRK